MVRARHDTLTSDLLSWQAPQVTVGYEASVAGRGPLESRIARIVARALRDARDNGQTRAEIAAELSVYLARKVPETMVDKWASEAAEDHRIPLDVFIGLIHVLGKGGSHDLPCHELLGFIPQMFGHVVVAEKHADVIRLTLLREHKADLEAQERALEARVRRNA